MKKVITVIITVLMVFSLNIGVFAHSGGTDSKGGHYDRSSGEYHYHHGYEAHFHYDGVCPIKDSIETTTEINNIIKEKEEERLEQEKKQNTKTTIWVIVGIVLVAVAGGLFYAYKKQN